MGTLASLAVRLLGDNSDFYSKLDDASARTDSWASGLGSKIASGLGTVVAGAATLAAGAILTIGNAAVDTVTQIDIAGDKATAQLGSIITEAHNVEGVIADVFGNNFGDSIADAGDAVAMTASQMSRFGQLTDQELSQSTQTALALRDAFDIDVAESTSAASTLMENFGLTADEAFTFIQSGLQNGLNKSGDFLDSIGEYSVQFAEGGASAAQFWSVMDTGLQGGMLGTDKAADLFKEFRVRIQDGSSGVSDALEAIGLDADAMADGFADGSLTAADAFTQVQRALKATDDQNAQFQAGVALMGTQFEDLGADAVFAIDTMGVNMQDLGNITNDLNQQYDNWPSMWEGIKRKAQVALIPLGEKILEIGQSLMPSMEDATAWLSEKLPGWIDTATTAFDNVSDWYNGTLVPAINTAKPIVEGLWEDAKDLAEGFVDGVTRITDALSGALPDAIDTAGGAFEGIQEFLQGDSFGVVADGVMRAVDVISSGITSFVSGVLLWFQSNWLTIKATFMTGWVVIQSVITAVLAVVWPAIQGFFAGLGGTFESFSPLFEAFKNLWASLQPVIAVVLQVVGAIILGFVGVMSSAFGAMVSIINPVIQIIVNLATQIVTALTGIINFVVAVFQGNWSAAWEAVKQTFWAIVNGIIVTIVNLGLTLATLISNLVTNIITYFTTLYNELVGSSIVPDMVLGVITWITQWVTELPAQILAAITAMIAQWVAGAASMITEAAALVTSIMEQFTGVDWGSVGAGIISGISNAISAGAGAIASAAKSAAEAALNAAKALLGISSPSKVAMLEIGAPFTEGIAIGVGDTSPIEKAVSDVNDALFSGGDRANNLAGGAGAGGAQGQLPPIIINITIERADNAQEAAEGARDGLLEAFDRLGLRL